MSDEHYFDIEWFDREREPQCAPNPNYPNGKDIDCSDNAEITCTVELPYPAKRCGLYVVHCSRCGLNIALTTAGRPDDPRSVKIGCRLH